MEVNAGVIDCKTPQHSRSWASWESGTGWHSYYDSLPASARHYIPSAEEKAPGPQGCMLDVVVLYHFFLRNTSTYGLCNSRLITRHLTVFILQSSACLKHLKTINLNDILFEHFESFRKLVKPFYCDGIASLKAQLTLSVDKACGPLGWQRLMPVSTPKTCGNTCWRSIES